MKPGCLYTLREDIIFIKYYGVQSIKKRILHRYDICLLLQVEYRDSDFITIFNKTRTGPHYFVKILHNRDIFYRNLSTTYKPIDIMFDEKFRELI